ncbi:MAG: DUF192 domain-containing protein, partial [Acidimicrobiales bacterium]|nr:DUF192 domain-containing protein [Acidimicrobiales bacterium]
MTLAERYLRWLLTGAALLIGFGIWALVLRGADQPADPELGRPASASSLAELAAPGDPSRVPLEGFTELAIAVEPPGGGDFLTWCLLAALDEAQRAQGLMDVTDLKGYAGMAFAYAEDVANTFYMKNTVMPLSIVWLDAAGDVVTITDMEPCGDRDPCPTYAPSGPYRMAIEDPKGKLPTLGITEGARVTPL